MRLLILGATGPCGIQLCKQALEREHTLVLYVRSPQKVPQDIASNPSVTVIEGALTDGEKLAAAMAGVHAVLSALGPSVIKGPFHPRDTPLAHAYEVVIATMKKLDIKRLIALGTPSMKDEHDRFDAEMSLIVSGISIFAHNAYKDVVAIGGVIRAASEELVWTIPRVPLLSEMEDRAVVAGYVGDGKSKNRLTKAAFAAFVVQELEDNAWCRKAPYISSP